MDTIDDKNVAWPAKGLMQVIFFISQNYRKSLYKFLVLNQKIL